MFIRTSHRRNHLGLQTKEDLVDNRGDRDRGLDDIHHPSHHIRDRIAAEIKMVEKKQTLVTATSGAGVLFTLGKIMLNCIKSSIKYAIFTHFVSDRV